MQITLIHPELCFNYQYQCTQNWKDFFKNGIDEHKRRAWNFQEVFRLRHNSHNEQKGKIKKIHFYTTLHSKLTANWWRVVCMVIIIKILDSFLLRAVYCCCIGWFSVFVIQIQRRVALWRIFTKGPFLCSAGFNWKMCYDYTNSYNFYQLSAYKLIESYSSWKAATMEMRPTLVLFHFYYFATFNPIFCYNECWRWCYFQRYGFIKKWERI